MGIKHLLDTNIVIYFLQKQFPLSAEQFVDNILEHSKPAISTISEIELLCWRTDKEEDINILKGFIKAIIVFELEKEIRIKTVEIRKAYKIKLPDAIIAATALIYDLSLVTRNTKDFKNIEGLKIINPFELEIEK